MSGFRWDPKAFQLGGERFAALGNDSGDYLQTMAHNVSSWENMTGLLGVLAPHHDTLTGELRLSALCTPAMLNQITTNLDEVAKRYAAAEDASRVSIEGVWDDLGYDLPEGGDANLERFGRGDYDFGSDFPPHTAPESGDFTIVEMVNKILGWPSSGALPPGDLKNPLLKAVWDSLVKEFYDMAKWLSTMLTGDWAGASYAGDSMCKASDYWQELSLLSARAGGALFRGWDGTASESAERFVEKVCTLFWSAPASLDLCGQYYKEHAQGCHLLFHEIYTLLTELLDLASAVMAILDSADSSAISLEYLHSCLTYALEVVALGFKTIAKVVEKVLLVLRVVEAIVAAAISCSTLFATYNNEMRGNLKF